MRSERNIKKRDSTFYLARMLLVITWVWFLVVGNPLLSQLAGGFITRVIFYLVWPVFILIALSQSRDAAIAISLIIQDRRFRVLLGGILFLLTVFYLEDLLSNSYRSIKSVGFPLLVLPLFFLSFALLVRRVGQSMVMSPLVVTPTVFCLLGGLYILRIGMPLADVQSQVLYEINTSVILGRPAGYLASISWLTSLAFYGVAAALLMLPSTKTASRRRLIWLAIIVNVTMILVSDRQGALMGVGFVFFVWLAHQSRKPVWAWFVAALLAIVTVVVVVGFPSVLAWLNNQSNGRFDLWQGVLNFVSSDARLLWFGSGLATNEITGLSGYTFFTHGAYFTMLYQRGVIGVFAMLVVLVVIGMTWYRSLHGLQKDAFVGVYGGYLLQLVADGSVFIDLGYVFTYTLVLVYFGGFVASAAGESDSEPVQILSKSHSGTRYPAARTVR